MNFIFCVTKILFLRVYYIFTKIVGTFMLQNSENRFSNISVAEKNRETQNCWLVRLTNAENYYQYHLEFSSTTKPWLSQNSQI